MIRTTFSVDKVPTAWIFEYYCNLTDKLHGQDIIISSVFTVPQESKPSMRIYVNRNKYVFTDFSSGYNGTAYDLVMLIFNLTYYEAARKVTEEYSKHKGANPVIVELEETSKFKVISFTERKWNELDAKFWTQFHIGSQLLGKYNVRPLSGFVLKKDDEILEVEGNYIYGYFKSNGELYKIYQPKRDNFKFFNLLPYVQGTDQMTYSKSILIICSSLKDIMALDVLNFDVESIAPNGENNILPRRLLAAYSLKYDRILALLDNDPTGHRAMAKYQEMYGIEGIYLNMSKDLSDSTRDFGIAKTRQYLSPLILTT